MFTSIIEHHHFCHHDYLSTFYPYHLYDLLSLLSQPLPGMYVHNHNTYSNNENCSGPVWREKYEVNTFGKLLQDAGYLTGEVWFAGSASVILLRNTTGVVEAVVVVVNGGTCNTFNSTHRDRR